MRTILTMQPLNLNITGRVIFRRNRLTLLPAPAHFLITYLVPLENIQLTSFEIDCIFQFV